MMFGSAADLTVEQLRARNDAIGGALLAHLNPSAYREMGARLSSMGFFDEVSTSTA